MNPGWGIVPTRLMRKPVSDTGMLAGPVSKEIYVNCVFADLERAIVSAVKFLCQAL